MFLAFSLSDCIRIPFGYLLDWLYQLTSSYGLALILFALAVKIILYPIQAKSKKGMMKMSRMQPRVQAIQKKYADDPAKQNQMVQELYRKEGVSMTGGCLWSFVPLLLLLPLYQVVRQPIVYMLHESSDTAAKIVEIIKNADPSLFGKNNYYDQMIAARHIPEFLSAIQAELPNLREATQAGINFTFLGIDLGTVPQFNVFASSWVWNWANIGAFLIPIFSAGSQVLSMFVSQKMNNSVITNEKGLQDEETAKKSQQNQSTQVMMWMMPLMSLWIGFTVPNALSLYWFVQGVIAMLQDIYLTKHYRKIYDAEDAVRLQKALEEEAAEAEKERQRAERRAANPDGITDNTSKKKMQKKQQQADAEARAAAAREYAAKKNPDAAEETEDVKQVLSGVPSRPYSKGRAYDPNRYDSNSTEE